MIFIPLPLSGSYEVQLTPSGDSRGWFSRFYCKKEFTIVGHVKEWVQMNHSFTEKKGTIRGMHYQLPPYEEIKMVRCISGSIQDVIIDIRRNSPTFLKWYSIQLSSENKKMLYIPTGFAHGFQTLTDNCELIYFHSNYYAPGQERGINFKDPVIAIDWLLPVSVVSEKDNGNPFIDEKFKGI